MEGSGAGLTWKVRPTPGSSSSVEAVGVAASPSGIPKGYLKTAGHNPPTCYGIGEVSWGPWKSGKDSAIGKSMNELKIAQSKQP